jgi:hypothetical protein
MVLTLVAGWGDRAGSLQGHRAAATACAVPVCVCVCVLCCTHPVCVYVFAAARCCRRRWGACRSWWRWRRVL